jgi:hypothetical protein
MTSLISPSFNGRLLQTVREQAAAEPVRTWPVRSLQTALKILRDVRESAVDARHELADELSAGVEARSFAGAYQEYLPVLEEQVGIVRQLIELASPAEDPSSQSLVAELRLLETENQAFRDLLADALARASAPVRPVDWERVRAAEEAHGRGETKPFSPP